MSAITRSRRCFAAHLGADAATRSLRTTRTRGSAHSARAAVHPATTPAARPCRDAADRAGAHGSSELVSARACVRGLASLSVIIVAVMPSENLEIEREVSTPRLRRPATKSAADSACCADERCTRLQRQLPFDRCLAGGPGAAATIP
jgi:hypothetical protein